MSRDLGRDVPDLEKLYARKPWADFSLPKEGYIQGWGVGMSEIWPPRKKGVQKRLRAEKLRAHFSFPTSAPHLYDCDGDGHPCDASGDITALSPLRIFSGYF